MASKKTKRRQENRRRSRGNRRENRHERRHQQHSGNGEWDCISIPDGLEVFKPERGETYNIDVIPYIVGKHNRNADEGDEYFEMSYPVYRDLGIDEKRYIAIRELKGVADPVAEHFAKLRRQDVDWDDMKPFKATWRQLMLVFVHEQPDKGLQLFEGAYGTFGELLDEEIKSNEEEYVDNFDDPEHGATLRVRFKAKNIGQANLWVLASKINFEEREDGFTADGDEDLASEILDQAAEICLDNLLKIPTYAQLKAALEGQPEVDEEEEEEEQPSRRMRRRRPATEPEDEEEEEEPKRRSRRGKRLGGSKGKTKPEPEEEEDEEDEIPMLHKGDTVDHDEHGRSKIIRISNDGKKATIRDEDGDVRKNVPVSELTIATEPEDEEEEEEPPKKGKTKAAPKNKTRSKTKQKETTEDEDDGGDDWDDDWDD